MLKISVVVFGVMLCDLTMQVYAADQSPSSVEQATAGQQSTSNRQQATEKTEVLVSDTLSGIALRVRPNDSVSIEQVMLAIQAANPNAFIGGNINRMRSDLDLRVPSLREIISVDAQTAINEVARQIQEVSEIEAEPLAPSMDATLTQGDQTQGQLNVIAINDELTEASRRIDGSAYEENFELDRQIAQLETQLALEQEEEDRTRRRREELDSRLMELEIQIAVAQEIVSLQDLQLAQVQESIVEAARLAELEIAQSIAAAIEPDTLEPAPGSTSLIEDIRRIFTNNALITVFSTVLVILLVALLMRRNKIYDSEDESIDELAERKLHPMGESDDPRAATEEDMKKGVEEKTECESDADISDKAATAAGSEYDLDDDERKLIVEPESLEVTGAEAGSYDKEGSEGFVGKKEADNLDFLTDNEPESLEEIEETEENESLSDLDEAATKLELAYAYQKMGDIDGAREILQEVIEEGSEAQVKEAENSLASLDNAHD